MLSLIEMKCCILRKLMKLYDISYIIIRKYDVVLLLFVWLLFVLERYEC